MEPLFGAKIADANLADWRHLAQGMHARYLMPDFAAGARFVSAVAQAAAEAGHFPQVQLDASAVNLKLISDDAVYRDGDTEHVVSWVTSKDIDLARRITDLAAEHGLTPDPTGVTVLELGLDIKDSKAVAPTWAMLLTGDATAQGHGSPSDEVRDAGGRVPNLWFADDSAHAAEGQRVHVEVYVAADVVEARIAAVVAAGGTVVDDSESPTLTVIADAEGNRAVICADVESWRAE